MSITLTILGCHSATPRINAFPTSQYLEINNSHFLIDCGEPFLAFGVSVE